MSSLSVTMDNRVDHANPFTNQIFQEAVIRSDMAIVKLLLKFGIYPKRNERNRQGLTALQQCVLDGNGRMAILLLEAGADIEAKTSNGWTCLHIASALGDLDILTTLVNHCCDLVALTKNEELPIDLAASRDIKIKLAKEMSRVGYSELAQWYMRKLAAREGVFYVLSTDTLLDLACDDKEERNSNNDYLYYVRQYNQHRDMFIHSPVRKDQNASLRHSVDSKTASPKKDMWLEPYAHEQMTYLTYSSGYLSEAVFDPASGQYSNKVLSSTESPQRKILEERVSLASISEVDSAPPDETKSRSGTLKRTSSNKRHSQNMSRKPSTIELHIDYTHTTESESDEDEEDSFENDVTISQQVAIETPLRQQNQHPSPSSRTMERLKEVDETAKIDDTVVSKEQKIMNRPPPPEFSDAVESKNRKIKFNPGDTNNEFCNCPNCKKLGYAFSPDIQTGSRKNFHVPPKALEVIPQDAAATGYNRFYYPETTTDRNAMYFDQEYQYKPRKRKKKLFSGIKSMFKDSIKVRTNMDSSPACDDAGILFSVSLRDKNKSKSIKQRHEVRRSNSFSGVDNNYPHHEEVPVLPHSQVVAPPPKFSDMYQEEKHLANVEKYYSGNEPEIPVEYNKYDAAFVQTPPQDCHAFPPTRNTYEKHHHNNGVASNGEGSMYYPDNVAAYCDSTTLPHGFHYTRPVPSSSNGHSQHRYYGQQHVETNYDPQLMMSDAKINEMMSHEYIDNGPEDEADNCLFCTPPQPISSATMAMATETIE